MCSTLQILLAGEAGNHQPEFAVGASPNTSAQYMEANSDNVVLTVRRKPSAVASANAVPKSA